MKRKLGFLPSPGIAWKIDKTAASIRFVREAEKWISNSDFKTAGMVDMVKSTIHLIKNGKLVLVSHINFQYWIDGTL